MVLSRRQHRQSSTDVRPVVERLHTLSPPNAWIGLAGALLAALIIRLAMIGAQSAWLDEGYSLAVAHHAAGFILSFTARSDIHPPLYYLALHAWLAVTGYGLEQARLLSALSGVVAVAAIYALAAELFDRPTAVWAALLLAVSPLASWYSDETRMYAMTGLFTLLALALLVRAVRRGYRVAWVGFVVCAALAFYTDYSAAYVLAGATVCALFMRRGAGLSARPWLISVLALAVLIAPALALLRWQEAHNLSSIAWIPAPTPGVVGGVLVDLIGLHTPMPAVVVVAGLILAALSFLAVRTDYRRPRLRRSYLFVASIALAPIVLALVLSLGQSVFLTRTVMASVYGLLIFFARGLAARTPRRVAWSVLALAPLLAVDAVSLHAAYATTINEDWRGAASYLSTRALPGDVILFGQGFLQLPFDVYWNRYNRRNAQRGYPTDEVLLTDQPRNLMTAGSLTRATAGAKTVWFITRDATPSSHPGAPANSLLRGRWRLAGTHAFTGVTIYRLTTLPVAGAADAASWLDAAAVALRHIAPHDLVLLRGSGADAFVRSWSSYPHAQARLLRLTGVEQGRDLTAALDARARTIWLATTTTGSGDPAGIAGGWLYRQGPQSGAAQTFGHIRLYRFTHGWTK